MNFSELKYKVIYIPYYFGLIQNGQASNVSDKSLSTVWSGKGIYERLREICQHKPAEKQQ